MLICTGAWGTAWERHAKDFYESFHRYWPQTTRLIVYTDRDDLPIEARQLNSIPGYDDFIERYTLNPFANGRRPIDRRTWKPLDEVRGYSWKHDAIHWFAQALIPSACVDEADGMLVWLDSDVITKAPVYEGWIEELVGGYDGAYLGRDCYSEIGFWAVRLPQGRPMVADFAERYLDGSFLAEREWHSAWIWDLAREASGLNMRDLTPGGAGHVFPDSPLAYHLEHRKGGLKQKA